jgi:alpha-tubulin suppressor-like RCC1 family protein
VVKASNGAFHTIAINSTGQLYVWGWNRTHNCGGTMDVYTNATTGQVDSTVFFKYPIPHVLYNTIVDVAAGEGHSLMVNTVGAVLSWGINSHGQTGQPLTEEITERPKVIKVGNTVRYARNVSAGFDHSMLLGNDGRVWCWGGNASGQLGDGTTTDRPTPQPVPGLSGIRAIAAGDGYSLALDSAGNVWAWGNNVLGQLGDGTRTGRFSPVQVSRLDAVQGVVAGGAHAMAVRADGGLWTWGTNPVGQLGEGPITNLSPVPLNTPLGPLRVERLATK